MTDIEKFEALFTSTGIEYDKIRDGAAYCLLFDNSNPILREDNYFSFDFNPDGSFKCLDSN